MRTEDLAGNSTDGVKEIVIDTPTPPAVQSFKVMLGKLLPREPSTIERKKTLLLRAKTHPDVSTIETETLLSGGCPESAFVTVPGNESVIGWPIPNEPDDI
jgi:hypothetical protein